MKRILCVNCDSVEGTHFPWESAGHYQILKAASPVEALDICRKHSGVDLLVCPADLGLVSGMELASLLRAWNSNLRIILTSGLPCEYWTERQEMQLKELPPDDVLILEQPFGSREMRAAIARLLPAEIAVASGAH
jgi:CheY-like chemotaxis protein